MPKTAAAGIDIELSGVHFPKGGGGHTDALFEGRREVGAVRKTDLIGDLRDAQRRFGQQELCLYQSLYSDELGVRDSQTSPERLQKPPFSSAQAVGQFFNRRRICQAASKRSPCRPDQRLILGNIKLLRLFHLRQSTQTAQLQVYADAFYDLFNGKGLRNIIDSTGL